MIKYKLIAILLVFFLLAGPIVNADTGSIEVENVPPKFSQIFVKEENGLSLIQLNVSYSPI